MQWNQCLPSRMHETKLMPKCVIITCTQWKQAASHRAPSSCRSPGLRSGRAVLFRWLRPSSLHLCPNKKQRFFPQNLPLKNNPLKAFAESFKLWCFLSLCLSLILKNKYYLGKCVSLKWPWSVSHYWVIIQISWPNGWGKKVHLIIALQDMTSQLPVLAILVNEPFKYPFKEPLRKCCCSNINIKNKCKNQLF